MAGICSHLECVLSRLLWIFVHSSRTHNGLLRGGEIEWIIPHFPEYYPTFQSISHLTNRGRAWVRKNLEMMIVVVVRSLQSSSASVGLCIIIHTIQYYVGGVFWAAYLLQIKSEIANKKFILGSQRCHKLLCSLSLCPDMRCGKEWRHDLAQSWVWCVPWSWQLQCCCCCCCCIGPPLLMIHAASPTNPL